MAWEMYVFVFVFESAIDRRKQCKTNEISIGIDAVLYVYTFIYISVYVIYNFVINHALSHKWHS